MGVDFGTVDGPGGVEGGGEEGIDKGGADAAVMVNKIGSRAWLEGCREAYMSTPTTWRWESWLSE